MKELTKQEQRVLKFIKKYHKDTRLVPTSVAIAKHMKVSGQRVRQIIKSLVEKGALEKTVRFGLYRLSTDES